MIERVEEELGRLAGLCVSDDWNETDVREEVLAPLLRLLGYQKGSDYDINREQHLLVHPFLMRGSEKVRLDYAVMVRRQYFWVLEAKRPSASVEGAAIHQAYFYAIHPEVQARFFAVCNGRELCVFDVREVDERYVPTIRFSLAELVQHFSHLRDTIGSGKVRDELARRALGDLRKVLQSEVRTDRLDGLDRDLRQLVAEGREAVENNVRSLWRQQREQRDDDIRRMFPRNSCVQIARVAFEFIDTAHDFGLVFDVLREKLNALSSVEFDSVIRQIVGVLNEDLTSSGRLRVVQVLLRLLPELGASLATYVRERIRSEVRSVILGFPDNERPRLLWAIEGRVKRVPYKVSVVRGDFTAMLGAVVNKKRTTLPEAELVVQPPSIWGERHAWSVRRASELFHRLASLSSDELKEIIVELDRLETQVEPNFLELTRDGIDGESEPPTFVYFDRYLDCYRSALFSILLSEFDEATGLIGDDELTTIEALLCRVQENVYYLNHAEVFWARMVHSRGGMDHPLDPESGQPLTAESVKLLMKKPIIHRRGVSAVNEGVRIWGEIGNGRWAEYPARLNFADRRLEVGEGVLRR